MSSVIDKHIRMILVINFLLIFSSVLILVSTRIKIDAEMFDRWTRSDQSKYEESLQEKLKDLKSRILTLERGK